uniref:Uncharacterized protein n=1 Tax=Leersia perrieri TaxID=77586 RepID=A0A0D9XAW6_9ORYZ
MDKAPQTDMERRLMDQLKDGKFTKNAPVRSERRGCYYTTVPASIKLTNTSGNELTALNLDKTSLLESVLSKNYQGQEDLLTGSFYAMESIGGDEAAMKLAIYYQLKHGFQCTHDSSSGEDMGNSLFLDEAWFSRDIFLYHLSKTRKLKSLLETTFGWDLDDNMANLIDEDDEIDKSWTKPDSRASTVPDRVTR